MSTKFRATLSFVYDGTVMHSAAGPVRRTRRSGGSADAAGRLDRGLRGLLVDTGDGVITGLNNSLGQREH